MEPNDIPFTNEYIEYPELKYDLDEESMQDFKRYYLSQVNEHIYPEPKGNTRSLLEVKTLVSVDSRDRDIALFPKPNNFKIYLGKDFLNVRSIKLVSVEFPNTDAVINSSNNMIYWRNQQDIALDYTVADNDKRAYPIYSTELRIGSYIANTLKNEMVTKLNSVRTKKGVSDGVSTTGDFHSFVVDIDIDTNIVSFTSLNLTQLPVNPFSTTQSSGIVLVEAPVHGLTNGDRVYILGSNAIAGISSELINGFHYITFINENSFTFEVNVNAASTLTGGGNLVKSGIVSPFQMLWGSQENTVAQNIGFPLEDSSELIKTKIANGSPVTQMIISSPGHLLPRNASVIGSTLDIGYLSNGLFFAFQTFLITDITDSAGILVQVAPGTVTALTGNSQATHFRYAGGTPRPIVLLSRYNQEAFALVTETPHGYFLDDTNENVVLLETRDLSDVSSPNFDGAYKILQVPNENVLHLQGNVSTSRGSVPTKDPIQIGILAIADIAQNEITVNDETFTRVTTVEPHNFIPGDSIYFNNVTSTPMLRTVTVDQVISEFSFLIKKRIFNTQFDSSAFIGHGLATLYFPDHGFNTVTDVIVNGSFVTIETLLDHTFSVGDSVRLNVNTTPPLEFVPEIVSVTSDTFTFEYGTSLIVPVNLTGVIGLNTELFLHNVNSFHLETKGKVLNVRNCIDKDHVTFWIPGGFSTKNERGGGSGVYISSLLHGFAGVQTNTKNNLLNRSINLEGENYTFLTCPQLATMKNTGSVENIFARLSLNQAPGYICFDFLSNEKRYNSTPLSKLSELEFSVVNYNNALYEFNDLDFSFTLEITEVIDITNNLNISSKRGIVDVS